MITKFKLFEHNELDPYSEENWNNEIDPDENDQYVGDFYWHQIIPMDNDGRILYLDLYLIDYDSSMRKQLIMAMHKVFNFYSIKEIQDILNNCPLILKENVDSPEGEVIKEILERAGAVIEIKPRYIN